MIRRRTESCCSVGQAYTLRTHRCRCIHCILYVQVAKVTHAHGEVRDDIAAVIATLGDSSEAAAANVNATVINVAVDD